MSSERVASEQVPAERVPAGQLAPADQSCRDAAAHDLRSTLAAIALASANLRRVVPAPAAGLDPDQVTLGLAAIDAAVAEAGQLLGRLVD